MEISLRPSFLRTASRTEPAPVTNSSHFLKRISDAAGSAMVFLNLAPPSAVKVKAFLASTIIPFAFYKSLGVTPSIWRELLPMCASVYLIALPEDAEDSAAPVVHHSTESSGYAQKFFSLFESNVYIKQFCEGIGITGPRIRTVTSWKKTTAAQVALIVAANGAATYCSYLLSSRGVFEPTSLGILSPQHRLALEIAPMPMLITILALLRMPVTIPDRNLNEPSDEPSNQPFGG